MKLFNLFIKRLFDISSSLLLIIFLIPIWIIIPLVIKIDSRGPVLFKQKRRTINGKVFTILKFRSMVIDAEYQELGLFNYENDSRVTKVGSFLRKTSIDELPQLLNIFIGQMSVVGPRPCVEYELGDFNTLNKKYKKRFSMKAGLTGYAQVKGRNSLEWNKKVELDNLYIDKFSRIGVIFDIVILAMSIVKIFKKKDIYEKKMNADETISAKMVEEETIYLAHKEDE